MRSDFLKRHSLPFFFLVVFVISWGGIVLVICKFGGLPATKEQFDAQLPTAIPAMLLGPAMAGILMTGVACGKKGFRELLWRLLKWNASFGWYALAVLVGPLVLAATLLGLSLISPTYLPGIILSGNKTPLIISGIAGGIAVGIFEELGWTGFAVPMLRRRHSILAAGLIVGVAWGAWHVLSNDIWGSGPYAGSLPPVLYMSVSGFLSLVGQLLAYRILMVWVFDRTGSLPVTMLMHASLTASSMIFQPLGIAGAPLLSTA